MQKLLSYIYKPFFQEYHKTGDKGTKKKEMITENKKKKSIFATKLQKMNQSQYLFLEIL